MISIISMISNSQTENEYFLVDVVPICELGIYFCVLISVCVCVCVCMCACVCSMERVKKFRVFTSLKDDSLRAQCQFVGTDGALFLPHRINTIPGAQRNLLYNR